MFCVWQFCFRRASLSRFIHRFPSNQGQTHCFDLVCQLSPICNSPVDTPMIISSFIFTVNTCYQHDKLFTRRQIQIVLILFQSHCTYMSEGGMSRNVSNSLQGINSEEKIKIVRFILTTITLTSRVVEIFF
jgi:hypothetical protein